MAEILSLPTNKIPLTTEEKEMAEWLFPNKPEVVPKPTEKPREVKPISKTPPPMLTTPPPATRPSIYILSKIALVVSLFYVINLPKVDSKIRDLFRFQNAYLSTLCKTILFYLLIFSISVLV